MADATSTLAISQLTQYLISTAANYSVYARPAYQVPVLVAFTIVKTLQLNSAGYLDITSGLTFVWQDSRLAWDPSRFGNLTMMSLPSAYFWTPQILLLNPANEDIMINSDYIMGVVIDYRGRVTWLAPKRIISSCSLNYLKFPFDSQTCTISYSTNQIVKFNVFAVYFNVDPASNNSISRDAYIDTGEFSLTDASLNASGFAAGVCILQSCYPTFSVKLTYFRRSTYYMYNLIIPAVLLTILVPFAFLIPSENNVKVSMTCSLMVALYVLQQNVSRLLPAGSSYTYCSMGCMASLIIGCVSVIGAIITVSVRMRTPEVSSRCARVLRKLLGNTVAPLPEESASSYSQILLRHVKKGDVGSLSSAPADAAKLNAAGTQETNEELTLLRKMATLIERQTMTQQADALRVKKAGENAMDWKNLDFVINYSIFFLLIGAALAVIIVFDFQV